MAKDDLVEVDAVLIADLPDCWKVDSDSGNEDVLLPKSICKFDEDTGIFLVPEWLAMKEGLI